jgi:hypothetical protein
MVGVTGAKEMVVVENSPRMLGERADHLSVAPKDEDFVKMYIIN